MKISPAYAFALDWTERGYIPDAMIRRSIQTLIRQRLAQIDAEDCEKSADSKASFIQMMNASPVAIMTELANIQHYEVPAAFYRRVLGKHLKYSACYWSDETGDLDSAESDSLAIYCRRAELQDGQNILELGCGWGSLTLWMAEHYPLSRITAVSNSASQKDYILEQATRRGLSNIDVITCDMNDFDIGHKYDRVVSIEMFEHMHNYAELFKRISLWLEDDGLFFKHIFVHRDNPYEFVVRDETDWMSRYFFSGGIMPSDDLPLYYQEHLQISRTWRWDGTHYEKTANAWLANMDAQKESLMKDLGAIYGRDNAVKWWMRWRIFFMACAELFGYDNGQEWWVAHYQFRKR